jgi:hypothetical protein
MAVHDAVGIPLSLAAERQETMVALTGNVSCTTYCRMIKMLISMATSLHTSRKMPNDTKATVTNKNKHGLE